MEVPGSGPRGEIGGDLNAQTAAGSDFDSACRLLHELSERVCSGNDIGLTACGKDAVAASGDDVFEGLGEGCGVVESAIKRDFERSCELNQLSGALHIDCGIGVKDADNEASDAHRFQMSQILLHHFEFSVGIFKIAGPGTQQDVDRETAIIKYDANQSVARRQAIFNQSRAEFDSVRTALLAGDAGLYAFGAELENNFTLFLHTILGAELRSFST